MLTSAPLSSSPPNAQKIVVGVTKAVSDRFSHGGIADRMIWFNGFPFLDNKEEHSFGVSVSAAMTSFVMTLPSTGATLSDLERILASSPYQGFPILETDTVQNRSNILVGYIGRTELRYVLDRVKHNAPVNASAVCSFTRGEVSSANPVSAAPATPITPAIPIAYDSLTRTRIIDLSRFVDFTPLTVHPSLPLETAMELFKKMGPRVILVEHHGRLAGLVTVKDCLKYQFTAEAGHESPRDASAGQERVWNVMQDVARWISERLETLTAGRIKLRGGAENRETLVSPTERRSGPLFRERDSDATADNGSSAVELDNRSP